MIGQRNGLTVGATRPNMWFAVAMPRRHEPASGTRPGGTGPGGAGPGAGALRGLVGAGPSQVGIVGALRARDVSRPTRGDVEQALAKPEPTARPAPADAPTRQDEAGSGSTGGTSVSS
jgi:hypothetical protein